jgi:hypothetical protein
VARLTAIAVRSLCDPSQVQGDIHGPDLRDYKLRGQSWQPDSLSMFNSFVPSFSELSVLVFWIYPIDPQSINRHIYLCISLLLIIILFNNGVKSVETASVV